MYLIMSFTLSTMSFIPCCFPQSLNKKFKQCATYSCQYMGGHSQVIFLAIIFMATSLPKHVWTTFFWVHSHNLSCNLGGDIIGVQPATGCVDGTKEYITCCMNLHDVHQRPMDNILPSVRIDSAIIFVDGQVCFQLHKFLGIESCIVK